MIDDTEKPRNRFFQLEDKFNSSIIQPGWIPLPNVLFLYVGKLGITLAEQAVLYHLLGRWRDAKSPPALSKNTIANALGIQARQTQRHLRALERKKLIEISPAYDSGRSVNQYTFKGLIKKLDHIAKAHREAGKFRHHQADEMTAKIINRKISI